MYDGYKNKVLVITTHRHYVHQPIRCILAVLASNINGYNEIINNKNGLLFKNKPILSLVLLPSLKEMWFGVNGIGTWKESEKYNLQKKKVDFENKKFKNYPKNSLIKVLTSKNHNNHKLDLILKEMNYQNIIRMGSIGYKLCTNLRGDADV